MTARKTKTKTKLKRRYSDEERAEALAAVDANGGNVQATADQLGIPGPTVDYWKRGNVHPQVLEIHNENRLPLADRLEDLAHLLADSLPDKIPDANLQQAATSMAIAIDKMRLLREQPTSIPGKAELNDDELFARLRRLADRIKANPPAPADRRAETRTELPAADGGKGSATP